MTKKYSFRRELFGTEASNLSNIAEQLCNIANEKAIANRINAITALLSSTITPEERIKLEHELMHI